MVSANNVSIIVSPKVMAEIQYLTEQCSNEVGGLLGFEFVGPNILYCDNIVSMSGSSHTSSHFEVSPEEVSNVLFDIIEKGKGFYINGWWHSHVNMDTFLSGEDIDMIKSILINSKFVVSLVVNKSNKIYASVYSSVGEIVGNNNIDLMVKYLRR